MAGGIALALALAACGDSDEQDDGAAAAAECDPPDSSVTVGALDKIEFDASSYDADAGCVEVIYVNEGSMAHTLLVRDVDGFKLAVGDEDSGTIELEAGEYELYCDIAGHESGGMVATLTVS
jgi:plastocyanin